MHPASINNAALPLLFTVIFSLIGCITDTPIGPIRTTMTAPDLQYLPAEKLRTTMWVLAAEIQHLERLMSAPSEEERKSISLAVASSLERMRIAAKTLDEPGRSTQHPALNQNLAKFIDRLERAKRAVDRDPPNFFPASTVAGSCFLCHGGRSVARAGTHPDRHPLGESPNAWALASYATIQP